MAPGMKIINFSHPLTKEHLKDIENMVGSKIIEVKDVKFGLDPNQPFECQVSRLIDGIGLTPREWQTEPILINPPALSSAALILLAELHGKMGYFPSIIRLKEVGGRIPPEFVVAEIVNLQTIRNKARTSR